SPGVNHVARISRFTWDTGTDVVDPASEEVILEVDQPYGNHNAGMIAFGPDGYLYIALGDGGSGGDPDNYAQDPSSLLGSMLRIDVHPTNPADAYDVPADNPFIGQAGFQPETWAYGLRNPFRFSFDRNTGALWLGDVGQGAREEVNVIEAGGNYGWRVREGFLPFNDSLNTLPLSAFSDRVIDYGRSDGASVIGGHVYRGTRVPSLQGRYLYGDYVSGNVWALTWDSVGRTVIDNELIANVRNITAFGEDTAAHVHVVTAGGTIYEPRAVSGGTPSDPPALLSDTGVFADLPSLTAASGFIEYELNVPFWSDGTVKRRWVAVPDGERVDFDATGAWSFPVGTVVIKHFELELTEGNASSRRRLETRLLVHREDGWRGFTYRWNGTGSDATLLPGRAEETITVTLAAGGTRDQRYVYPSRTECLSCHTEAAGVTLGLRTRQLNRDFAYPAAVDNQLRSWNNIALFDRDIGSTSFEAYAASDDESVGLETRARAYLAVNCAQCHQPGGGAPTTLDLRFDVAAQDMNIIDVVPDAGDLGIADARLVAPGDRARSVLYQRMVGLGAERMPPVGSHVVDETGADLIGRWIDSL
ncbi:MAG: PQQ-dependent sugar dehydrogenase, partial [Pseudomonadota bacterium]